MFKLEEICEEISQIQIPMKPEELEAIGVHVEEEAPADEAERFQDGYIRDIHKCLAERRRNGCRAILVRPAATAAIFDVDPAEAYLIWQFTDSWQPFIEEEYPDRYEGDASPLSTPAGLPEGFVGPGDARKALVFAADVRHAKNLAEMFKTFGVNAAWVSGETPLSVRRAVLENLRTGELRMIVNCMVFTEGFDEPSLDAILVARPTQSLVLYCQMIGRGVRAYPGKKDCLFMDFVDNSARHRLISIQDLWMFYQTKRTEKSVAEFLARKLAKDRQGSAPGDRGKRSPVIDLNATNLPLLVNLENLSSSVKEIDLFGLDAFAWYKAGASHYVQVNDNFSLAIRPRVEDSAYVLYGVFPKAGLYGPLLDGPVAFDLAYGCGNAYLFDYGDRNLATKGHQWRKQAPSENQRGLFQKLNAEVKELSRGSISFREPAETKGDYSSAINALTSERVVLTGQRMELAEAKNFIRKNVHARIVMSDEVAVTVKSNGTATLEAAVRRVVATFSESKEGDFLHYLGRILTENQIVLDGNCVKIRQVNSPRYMTEKQLEAASERLREEIRLYAPDASVVLAGFPIFA